MKPFLFLLLVSLVASPLARASVESDVRAADAARVQATIAGDLSRLGDLLSDQLSYGQADGRVQTKIDFLAAVRASRMRYEAYDYEEMRITPIGDDVATISGRASLRVRDGDKYLTFRLRFLAVWHREAGGWKLFAYQSAQLPAPAGH